MHVYSDTELFALLREDKATADKAFVELYGRHSQRVYAYCLRVTGSTDDAYDIFQETFTKFYHSAAQERTMTNVAGFLLTIARNLCLNYKRNRKDVTNSIPELYSGSLTQAYEQEELLSLVNTALELLDFEYREAFVLRLYHGMNYEEIARITGDSIDAVRNRVWRAKEKIKTILSPYLADLSKL